MIQYSYAFTNSTGMVSPNKAGAIYQAQQDIVYASLQPYCSSILGYSTPVVTVQSTTTTTPLSTTVATVYTTTTVTGGQKRKRATSTPDVLTKYPNTVVSSACSAVATPVTQTSTITNLNTATAAVSISTTTTTVVSTTTSIADAACTPNTYTGFKIRAPSTPDGVQYVRGPDASIAYDVQQPILIDNVNPGIFTINPQDHTLVDRINGYNVDQAASGSLVYGYGSTVLCSLDGSTFVLSCQDSKYSNPEFQAGPSTDGNGNVQLFLDSPNNESSVRTQVVLIAECP